MYNLRSRRVGGQDNLAGWVVCEPWLWSK